MFIDVNTYIKSITYKKGCILVVFMSRREKTMTPFRYLDYRQFLRDWYGQMKAERRGFSFRAFSKKAGFQSPNFLKLVMEGQRNLSPEGLAKFAHGLELNKQEEDYFHHLVLMNQADSHEQKDLHYQKLLQSRKLKQIKPLKQEHYEYCSHWYHAVIRELVISSHFDGTPEWIVARIQPPLTVAQVAHSISILEKLGLIEKDPRGRWQQSTSLVTTGDEPLALELMNFHQGVLELAKGRLTEIPAQKRDVSAMVLGIQGDSLQLLKKRVQEFRKDVLKLASTATDPDEVVILTIQLFPVTVGLKGSCK